MAVASSLQLPHAIHFQKQYSICGHCNQLKLVPAVAIMVFAIWGLGPLLHYGRNLFFHRNDNNWKKSRTYYVLTSYLQPLLLWAGAILICRVLDPVTLSSDASQAVKLRLLNFVRSLSTVMAFAYCLSSLIQQAQKFFMETNDSNDARRMGFQFAGKAVYTAVWVAAFSLFMELLGFSTQKWVTAGSLGTVLLTLAGREHVGWWSPTIIRGDDREAIHIPNHKFTVNVVRNLTQKSHWRIKTHLAISHLDVNKINNIVADMRKVLSKNPQVEQQKLHRRVFLENINPENQALLDVAASKSAMLAFVLLSNVVNFLGAVILVSCFVKTSHFEEYLCVKEAILLDLLRVISHHRARLATPIRTIQKIFSDADLENFSETIFTRAGAAATRPFLLIESSKINGDDKAKARAARSSEEQETKVATSSGSKASTPTSDSSSSTVLDNKSSKKKNTGDARPKSGKVDAAQTHGSSPPSKPQLDGLHATGNSKDDAPQTDVSPVSSHPKHASDKSQATPPAGARPALEENIVLGVALEGSKRTLPIEEEMTPLSTTAEMKERAAVRNANGPTSAGKDKDGQVAVPGAATGDQRDEER
ncbi:hypothetical protein ACLOJK_003093 [Asimina triloba]